jgi:hypothetical protein
MAFLGPAFGIRGTLSGITLLGLVSSAAVEEESLQCYLKDHFIEFVCPIS